MYMYMYYNFVLVSANNTPMGGVIFLREDFNYNSSY